MSAKTINSESVIGDHVTLGKQVYIDFKTKVGNHAELADGASVTNEIFIGNHVKIGQDFQVDSSVDDGVILLSNR